MKSLVTLEDKTILITGASGGIGSQCAVLCSQLGARIILSGTNKNKIDAAMNQLEGTGHHCMVADITQYDRIEGLVDIAIKQTGVVDGFIHAAGIEMTVPLQMMNAQKYEKLFAVNVIAGFELCRILTKKKNISNQGGSIVFISSIMAAIAEKGKVGYCSSKSALLGGIRAMALELALKKIRVNAVLPAIVQTEMTNALFETIPEESKQGIIDTHPLGLGTPSDVAGMCAFLLSDAARWITGSEFIIDGGYKLH